MTPEALSLDQLVGIRTIDARGEMPGIGDGYDAFVMLLRIDGVIYWFQEDPKDGYRSRLDTIQIVNRSEIPAGALAEFEPMLLTLRMRADGDDHEVLYGVNEETGLVIFEVGTISASDYYPRFVATWTPDGCTPWWLTATLREET